MSLDHNTKKLYVPVYFSSNYYSNCQYLNQKYLHIFQKLQKTKTQKKKFYYNEFLTKKKKIIKNSTYTDNDTNL